MKRINKITYPELFHGKNKKRNYFEGWYFKHVDKEGAVNFSIIPGVSYEENKRYAFIQVIIGPEYKSYYLTFNYNDFSFSDEPFTIRIGENIFSLGHSYFDIDQQDIKLKGKIEFSQISRIERSFFEPNIMGFFAYFNFMQCNHGVISLNHSLSGMIEYNGKDIIFDGGKGYIEKDWGTSFPRKYCWIQCNNFSEWGNSLFFSIAHIPFMGFEFMGFISILKIKDKQYRFATYNGAKVLKAKFKDGNIEIIIKRKKHLLKISAKTKESRVLKAPKNGIMANDIKETLDGSVSLELYNDGKLIYKGISQNAGVEVVNMADI